tara:strand:+ start:2664 stop:4217 length:1554 start_codon:yes stop_codon:yes gene_type:complete
MPFKNYISVIEDLSRELPVGVRYRRLLEAIRHTIPCDAIALLRLSGEALRPIAFLGLREETRGRHFHPDHHPRLKQILEHQQLIRFPADSPLPDPYDGLMHLSGIDSRVHDCMGISIQVDGRNWGVITLDASRPGQFDETIPHAEELAITLTRAVITAAERIETLRQQVNRGQQVTEALNQERLSTGVVGSSTEIMRLISDVDVVAPTSMTVLIEGETGVGKELVARRLHMQSARADKPLIYLNCAALPETLAEAELFGHTRGAFTGASQARAGRFELADGGTLFLDEIGELPITLQATLLRVLQEGDIQRVGSDETHKVDVRVVAATNRNLKHEVAAGRFREDLYHRLSVFPLRVPALRERQRDVLELAEFFLERLQHRLNVQKLLLTADARETLLRYQWPGNVRELEHVLGRAALRAQRPSDHALVYIDRQTLALGDIELQPSDSGVDELDGGDQSGSGQGGFGSLAELTRCYQTRLISRVLQEQVGNVSAAARVLQVDRSNLLRLVKRLGIHVG